MNMSRRDFLLWAGGAAALGGLGYGLSRQWTPAPKTKAPPHDGFAVPDLVVRPVHRWDGRVFDVDRKGKTVRAVEEASGAGLWESRGAEGFVVPGAAFPLDVSTDGELWVANVGRKRLERLDPLDGRFIASWEPTEPFGGCCNPVRFAALPGGRFVTMEKGTRRACIYQPSGAVERVVTEALSPSEFDYFLGRVGASVMLYDVGTRRQWEIPYALPS